MTTAAMVVARLEVGGFNSRTLEEALVAPRAWKDVFPLITDTHNLIAELWDGPEGDKLVRYEDGSYIYFFGCTGGTGHLDTAMDLAFAMPHIEYEQAAWKLLTPALLM